MYSFVCSKYFLASGGAFAIIACIFCSSVCIAIAAAVARLHCCTACAVTTFCNATSCGGAGCCSCSLLPWSASSFWNFSLSALAKSDNHLEVSISFLHFSFFSAWWLSISSASCIFFSLLAISSLILSIFVLSFSASRLLFASC